MKRNIPFSQKLFWSIFFIFLGFTGCFFIFQYQREAEFAQEKLDTVLKTYNHQLHYRLLHDTTHQVDSIVKNFLDEIPNKDIRVTIIDPSGNVLFDNSADVEDLPNHNDREEVQKARKMEKRSFAIRLSETTGIRYFYSASNINSYIYRTALPYDPDTKGILAINIDFIYFMAIMVAIFILVLSRYSRRIGQTIAKLRDFARNIRDVKQDDKEYVFPNDELGEISKQIITLYHKQQKAKDDLAVEREKLIKHFQYSREGFAMFTDSGQEILSNILYIQFANLIADEDIHAAEEVIELPELAPIRKFLEQQGNSSRTRVLRETVTVDKAGKIFLVECMLFLNNSYEVSINDISRQEEESRMKRQLTQNVAHELKTPVSSIQGYLETIISNPDLPADKRAFFLERCYAQSTRLTGLLQDISVLNRLEEAGDLFDLTEVDLTKLITDISRECEQRMKAKNISCRLRLPQSLPIHGNNSLLYSIFRNLFDNSIAYGGEGITITVNCYKQDEKFYYFNFSDNGVGIEEKHINRIFERFYRVDTGRSRKLGGTGLGLSIVKNAVIFHKGQISAKSIIGKGVNFLFTLHK